MKLALLDKDGTLVRPKSGNTFVQAPDDQELIPGVKEAIAKLIADEYTLIVVSNQGGIGAGHKTLKNAISEMEYCMGLVPIKAAYFCPDYAGEQCICVYRPNRAVHPGEDTPDFASVSAHEYEIGAKYVGSFRKPNPGMLLTVSDAYPEASDILFVGDREEDRGAATSANIRFLWAKDWVESINV